MPDQETRFLEIETKIAFQENMLDALNEALTEQQRQLNETHRQLKRVLQQLESGNDEIGSPAEEAPPPHY